MLGLLLASSAAFAQPIFVQTGAKALLDEAITLFINGEPETAKLILRDLVNASVGFEKLAQEIQKRCLLAVKQGLPT